MLVLRQGAVQLDVVIGFAGTLCHHPLLLPQCPQPGSHLHAMCSRYPLILVCWGCRVFNPPRLLGIVVGFGVTLNL
jgi:hypothetical protein